MSRPRATVAHLKLSGVQNSAIVDHLGDQKPELANRDDIEKIFADTKAAYDAATADVKSRGVVLTSMRYTSKGAAYEIEIINPNYRVMSKAAAQLAALAKLLSRFNDDKTKDARQPDTVAVMFPDLLKGRAS